MIPTSIERGASQLLKAAAIALLVILYAIALTGCTQTTQAGTDQPITGQEDSSGWTDANQGNAAREVRVYLFPGSHVSGDLIVDVWVQASSGNERAGSGAEQAGGSSSTTQTATQEPSTDVDIDAEVDLP